MSTLAKSGKLKQTAETIHDALKQNALTPGTVRYGKMTIEIAHGNLPVLNLKMW